jgi:hypothetical protein
MLVGAIIASVAILLILGANDMTSQIVLSMLLITLSFVIGVWVGWTNAFEVWMGAAENRTYVYGTDDHRYKVTDMDDDR